MAAAAVALVIFIGAASPLHAAIYSTKQTVKHPRVHHRMGTAEVQVVASAPKFCYYMGGPHGAPWVCR